MVVAVADTSRLTIRTLGGDPRDAALAADARALGLAVPGGIHVADVIFFDRALDATEMAALQAVLVDPALRDATWDTPAGSAVEVGRLPGVTDPEAAAVHVAAELAGVAVEAVTTARRYELHAAVTTEHGVAELAALADRLLCNTVIERWQHGHLQPSFVDLHAAADLVVDAVAITNASDNELQRINAERGLALDLAELHAIARHFAGAGREPTDVELETLAQTWSEHCAHKTFRAAITVDRAASTADGATSTPSTDAAGEITPLLRQLRDTTDAIAAPFLRSAFVGNAGIVEFHPGVTVAVKAETHNHPSAIEPFGGANTGVGGVIRDVMGAAHRPIAITDILCFGPTDLPADQLPGGVLHPRLIRSGVVAGVADYGNKIGLPTVAGAVLYDRGYIANPLVYAGCIGVASADEPALDGPHPGDLVVCIGGGTGRDGLRGATFSSATMDATTGDVAGASVQIGDPIVEKLLIDVLAESRHLYSAITDCGAGGLSSAIGEMADGIGAEVDTDHVTLKYPGLRPWEIWLSEAQERMVLAVPPSSWAELQALCTRHGVDAAALGSFTGDGRLLVRHRHLTLLDLDTEFLHDGRPQRRMRAVLPQPSRHPDTAPAELLPGGVVPTLLALLAHPNIASKEAVIRRYDHEILGATVVRPLVGVAGDAPADGVVLASPGDRHGLAVGIGVNPWYGLIDPERMAHAVVDEAIRNVVAAGADPDRVALLDNFSWGDPRRPETLGELVAAVRGCCDASMAHRAPFVSGKDSLNNEYLGSDGLRHAVPPTLVITAVAHVADADAVITPTLQQAGNVLVLVGRTQAAFGGSHLHLLLGRGGGTVPAPDADAPVRYRNLHAAIRSGLVQSCHDVSEGGLAVAAAEMAIAARKGLRLHQLGHDDVVTALFSESSGRLLCEIAAADLSAFEVTMAEPVTVLGTVTDEPVIHLGEHAFTVDDAVAAFTGVAQ
jgi:phosphoribosylformylglycinamidine synthase